ncbi:MAG: flagellar protein export ATPase FliI [Desulfatiglandales bacterium]
MDALFNFDRFLKAVDNMNTIRMCGTVTKVVGFVTEALGPAVSIGSLCEICSREGKKRVKAEVMGFKNNRVLLVPLGEPRGIGPGSRVVALNQSATIKVGKSLLGRIIDGLGRPLDGKGPIISEEEYPIYSEPLNPMYRKLIEEPLDVGVRAINGLFTIGKGQRMGIFAGSGVGKSVLLGMMARHTKSDVNVIALIGERGREVNEFLEKDLGPEGLARSVVVVATSDNLPLIRMRGAFIAHAIAEYFRDKGMHVLLMMDSITRFAMAQREVGLATGEPPTTKGYTPSVFTLLPKLLERAGTGINGGTITGLYTVLVEGDDMNDPIADSVRSILDGHIVLSRELALQGHYPAIDVLSSISRVMDDIVSKEHKELARKVKSVVSTYKKAEDLINIGAYVPGSNSKIDYALQMIDKINMFLRQDSGEKYSFDESIRDLQLLFA